MQTHPYPFGLIPMILEYCYTAPHNHIVQTMIFDVLTFQLHDISVGATSNKHSENDSVCQLGTVA